MTAKRNVFFGIVAIFALMQLWQPKRNNHGDSNHTEFLQDFHISRNTGLILKNSCMDCHSNYTEYPWYTRVQPFGWWMDSHIDEGKSELNFDGIENYGNRRQISKFKSIISSIEDNTMPLSSYTLIHKSAKLSPREQKIITDWASAVLDSLEKTDNR
jgi:hypothetical protein